jgi:anthranilate synthase/aminodeoxychorismate synthase-like glutamine amidotransferase
VRALLIDNHDSFTYNLAHALGVLGADVEVRLSDMLSLDTVEALEPDALVISPGPRTPREAGISVALVERFAGRIPILGVCLGHQAIGAAFGATVVRAPRLVHGKTSPIRHDGRGVFRGIPDGFAAMRYHSLVLDAASLPPVLERSAWTDAGEVMGIRHRRHLVEGVQFHPESILTPEGSRLLENFLSLVPASSARAAG